MHRNASKSYERFKITSRKLSAAENTSSATMSMSSSSMLSSSASSSSSKSAEEVIFWLQEERKRPERQSAQIVEYGTFLLERGYIKRLGDDLWTVLEQVAIAALDVGNWELAELCLSRLDTRFPKSRRVATLRGMLYEGRGEFTRALHLYDELMANADEADVMLSRRRVAVLKAMDAADLRGNSTKAVDALTKHLETYYSDPEGWQELTSLYLEQAQYNKAIAALEELMLIVPQNGFYVLQYAETLYTQGDFALAYKAFLRVLDMGGVVSKTTNDTNSERGPEVRALWGLQATIAKLRDLPKKATSGDIKAESLDAIEQMVSDLILNQAYGGARKDSSTLSAARKVIAGTK
ncbi:unnamed protein product [Sympodiomycopsis kandeliae]